MDALTHAIEGYTTGAAWELSDCLNLESIQLIGKNLRKAVQNDPDGREGMAQAQYVTAMAYSNVGLGIAHSMAHTLGAVYDTPHGVACAMIDVEMLKRQIRRPWFIWEERANGTYVGEDIHFYEELMRAGITPYADGRVKCGHIGRKTYE